VRTWLTAAAAVIGILLSVVGWLWTDREGHADVSVREVRQCCATNTERIYTLERSIDARLDGIERTLVEIHAKLAQNTSLSRSLARSVGELEQGTERRGLAAEIRRPTSPE